MKNKTTPNQEKFVFTKKKQGIIKGLMHDFLNSYIVNYEHDFSRGIYTTELPETLEFKEFLQKRALFLKNIRFELQLYNIRINRGTIWLGIGFICQDVTITMRTNLEYSIKDKALKNQIINATKLWP